MEKVGFVGDDLGEAVEAFTQQVEGKKKVEGLELAPALANPGIGDGIRRVQAMNRMDIPQTWRAVVRSAVKKRGPVISVFPPRGTDPSDAGSRLTGAGVYAPEMSATPESFDCYLPEGTSPASAVELGAKAVRAFGYTGELQWTVRPRGLLPR
jgi:hypothetical protein